MTTIVYRDGVLASDSRITSKGYIHSDRCKKIYRLSDGAMLGLAGENLNGLQMLHDLKLQLKKFEKGEDKKKWLTSDRKYRGVEAILISPLGNVWYYSNGWEKLRHKEYPYYALGSGATIAMGALDYGASAVEAVKLAIKRDAYSGGRIQTLEL